VRKAPGSSALPGWGKAQRGRGRGGVRAAWVGGAGACGRGFPSRGRSFFFSSFYFTVFTFTYTCIHCLYPLPRRRSYTEARESPSRLDRGALSSKDPSSLLLFLISPFPAWRYVQLCRSPLHTNPDPIMISRTGPGQGLARRRCLINTC
jgi:hypothetical protein